MIMKKNFDLDAALDTYGRKIDEVFDLFFAKHRLRSSQFQGRLVDAIVKCFHILEPGLSKKTKALKILERIFFTLTQNCKSHSFSLILFIKKFNLNQLTIKKLLSSILYGIYYNEIKFSALQSNGDIEWLVIQILAEKISRIRLKVILKQLSIDQHIHLLAFILKRYREGSFAILNALKSLCLSHHDKAISSNYKILLDLILGLSGKIYDIKLFLDCLQHESKIDEENLKKILDVLKIHAKKSMTTCFIQFNKLISSMIEYPLIFFESYNNLKHYSSEDSPLEQKKKLQHLFKDYLDKKYTLHDFEKLLQTIGLYGQMPYIQVGGKEYFTTGVFDRIQFLYKIFKEPLAVAQLNPSEISSSISFALTFILHLETILHPEILKESSQLFSCAIATSGKYLVEQASLESILEGLQTSNFLNDVPLFVYDQSNALIFKRNQRYINRLNKHYSNSIVHISGCEAVSLAKKIGIVELINTSQRGYMGFGGSRNCIFLLSPLLRHLFKLEKGFKKISDVQNMDDRELIKLFQQIVLRNDAESNNAILMVDDDMEIPAANIFSHALFARQSKQEYSHTYGICVGRVTKHLNIFHNLDEILKHPAVIFESTQWLNIPFSVKMAEYIGKPKVCLNLPIGQEEGHLRIESYTNPLLHTCNHLGGTRYPTSLIPSHFFVGLEAYLKKMIPYVFGISLSMDLIDPSNSSNRCILPWNDHNTFTTFKCLNDVFTYIANEITAKEMQKRFWKNVNKVFHSAEGPLVPLRQDIDKLRRLDIDAILNEFKRTHQLDHTENLSLKHIGSVYKFYQLDIKLLWEFGSQLLSLKLDENTNNIELAIDHTMNGLEKKHLIQFIDLPITYSFFLMCHSLGAGEFSRIIKSQILHNFP